MRNNDPKEHMTDRVSNQESLANCRNHLESIQNLRYLTSLEADHPTQVRLHLRMMEWHIQNLTEAMLPLS